MKKTVILLLISFISTSIFSQSNSNIVIFPEQSCPANWSKIKRGDLYGFIDINGNIVVPCEYNSFSPYGESGHGRWIKAKKDGFYGFIDINGNTAVPCEYDSFERFGESGNATWIKAEQSGLYGFINITGDVVVPCEYDFFERFGESGNARWIKVKKDDFYGFIDATGNVVVPCKYDSFERFGESGNARWVGAKKDGKYGFIDASGKVIVPCEYDSFERFGESGNARWIGAKKDGKYGFIDINGNMVVPFDFSNQSEINRKYPNIIQIDLSNIEIDKSCNRAIKDLTALLSMSDKSAIKDDIEYIESKLVKYLSKKDIREFTYVDVDNIENISSKIRSYDDIEKIKGEVTELIEYIEQVKSKNTTFVTLQGPTYLVSKSEHRSYKKAYKKADSSKSDKAEIKPEDETPKVNSFSISIEDGSSKLRYRGEGSCNINRYFNNESFNSVEYFSLDDISRLNINLDINSESGVVTIVVISPSGKEFIKATANGEKINVKKSRSIKGNEVSKYQGDWTITMDAKDAKGSYKIEINTIDPNTSQKSKI